MPAGSNFLTGRCQEPRRIPCRLTRCKETPDMPAPVAYFEFHTPDAAKARGFYGELFNWKFTDENAGQYFMVESGGDMPGGLMQDTASPPMVLSYFHVPDLDRAVEKAQKLGARLLKPRE